ncbi:hypothetical protein D7Z54_19740 [Salibacterium salarium]|uniref:Uncharacterized protein n=1 Tax=Salibacterium salarium TaxID=284579 RepID=A0A428MZR9_9BACI|nr:hypothetical protein [Salibacterium salarium]RSL31674.1 hypothetical protein D7Z54_19740 [Salibacterium salarium]
MVRLKGGKYYTCVFGHSVALVYLQNNICELYINRKYIGLCPFHYVRRKIYVLEKKSKTKRIEYKGTNLWEEAVKGTLINVTV